MRLGTIIAIVVFVVAAILGLLQLWWVPFEWILFTKIMITLVVVWVVVVGVALAHREYVQGKDLKDSGYVD